MEELSFSALKRIRRQGMKKFKAKRRRCWFRWRRHSFRWKSPHFQRSKDLGSKERRNLKRGGGEGGGGVWPVYGNVFILYCLNMFLLHRCFICSLPVLVLLVFQSLSHLFCWFFVCVFSFSNFHVSFFHSFPAYIPVVSLQPSYSFARACCRMYTDTGYLVFNVCQSESSL